MWLFQLKHRIWQLKCRLGGCIIHCKGGRCLTVGTFKQCMNSLGLKPLYLLIAWAAGAHAAADGAADLHTVRAGDTLIRICQRASTGPCDWREVQRLNGLNNPRRLMPGQVLRLAAPAVPAPPLPPEEALLVEMVHAHGQVTLQRPGLAALPLVGGEPLRAGDTVRTGAQSSASMRLPDGSRLVLHAHSEVLLERHAKRRTDAGQDTQLHLQRGSLDTRVQPAAAGQPVPRLQIRTHVANLGVRGTEFRTRVTEGGAALEVLQGRVAATAQTGNATAALSAAASAEVAAGQGLVAQAEGLGAVRALPAPPNLQTLPVLVQHLPLLLDFSGTARASRWRARVSAPGAPDQPLLEGVFGTPMARWADPLPDGTYELRVRATDETGLEGPDAVASFVLKARPVAPWPVSLDPAAAQASAAGHSLPGQPAHLARLAWQVQPEAASYQVQLADDSSFAALRAVRRGITATTLDLGLPPGRYVWRVASVRADGNAGPWSDSQVLVVNPTPAVPPPPAPPAPEAPGPWWLLWLPLLLWLL